MYETTFTLITRKLGFVIPFEILKNICRNAIVRTPFSEELIYRKITSLEDIRTLGFREMEWWTPYLRPISPVEIARLTSMNTAVEKALIDFIPGWGNSREYTPQHRRTQENMDIKALCLDMERHHNPKKWLHIVPNFDGWVTCGKPVGKYRKFELATIWPTLYGKGGWVNKLKKQ